jgi:hypothetical protein
MAKQKNLVQIIRDNPGCVAIVDNDSWSLYKSHPNNVDWSEVDEDEWYKTNELASSEDAFNDLPMDGYGAGNCYGGDILQALARIVGITVESV